MADPLTAVAIQQQIEDTFVAGGGAVRVPGGHHAMDDPLDLRDGVFLVGPGKGACVLDFSACPLLGARRGLVDGRGSVSGPLALMAPIAAHADAIALLDPTGVAPGDVLILADETDGSWHPARPYYRKGEFVRVAKVEDGTVWLEWQTYDAYDGPAVSVRKVLPIRTGIAGLTLVGKPGAPIARIEWGVGCLYDDVDALHSNVYGLGFVRSFDCAARNAGCRDWGPYTGQTLPGTPDHNYGLYVCHAQRIVAGDSSFVGLRRGSAITGSGDLDEPRAVSPVNRDILFHDSTIGSHNHTRQNGADMHGNVEHVAYKDCILPDGVIVAGDHTEIKGCTIRSHDGTAVVMRASEVVGWSHTLEGNEIAATADHADGAGLVVLAPNAVKRPGGLLRIAANRIDLGPYASTSYPTLPARAVWVVNNGGSSDVDVVAEGNAVAGAATESGPYRGIEILGRIGRGFRHVAVKDNMLVRAGIRMEKLGTAPVQRGNDVFAPLDPDGAIVIRA